MTDHQKVDIGILLDKCGIKYTEEQLKKLKELLETLALTSMQADSGPMVPRKIELSKLKSKVIFLKNYESAISLQTLLIYSNPYEN